MTGREATSKLTAKLTAKLNNQADFGEQGEGECVERVVSVMEAKVDC